MSKLGNIGKSIITNKDSLPDWYDKRYDTCNSCLYNSKNMDSSDKNLIEKGWELSGEFCSICKCKTKLKIKVAEESCPKGFWQKETAEENKKIDIEVLSKDMVTLYYEKDTPILDYGIIKAHSNSTINLQLIAKKYVNTSLSVSCGCTVPKLTKNEKGYILNITYDTKRLGAFTKSITIRFTDRGTQENLTLRVTGTVSNK